MERKELKEWAKKKIKGHTLELFVVVLVVSFLTNLSVGYKVVQTGESFKVESGISLGIFFAFVNVGLVAYMTKFIKDQEYKFTDIFSYVNDYVRIFLTTLLETVFVFLWALLLIVPGIIKLFGYALVPFLLADEKYNDLGYKALLQKSEEMMDGHKLDYFILGLSFIGWHLLAIPTLGLIEIWVMPYNSVTTHKFLIDIKENYEKTHNNA